MIAQSYRRVFGWRDLEDSKKATNFIQFTPVDRAYLVLTELLSFWRSILWVEAMAYEQNPDSIVAPIFRRDGSFSSDWVILILMVIMINMRLHFCGKSTWCPKRRFILRWHSRGYSLGCCLGSRGCDTIEWLVRRNENPIIPNTLWCKKNKSVMGA